MVWFPFLWVSSEMKWGIRLFFKKFLFLKLFVLFITVSVWKRKWKTILDPQEMDTRMCSSLGVWKEVVNRQPFKKWNLVNPEHWPCWFISWQSGLLRPYEEANGNNPFAMTISPLDWINSSMAWDSPILQLPNSPHCLISSIPWQAPKLLTFCNDYVTNCGAFIRVGHFCQARLLCFLFGCVLGPKVPAFVQHVKSG